MTDDFVILILTHGRPHKQTTYNTLMKAGIISPIYFVVDDMDKTLPEYKAAYPGKVITFSKAEVKKSFDCMDNFPSMRGVVYPRNACFQIAENLGFRDFIALDDDYSAIIYKFDRSGNFKEQPIKSLAGVLTSLFRFYRSIPAKTLAIAQNGDFIGGKAGSYAKSIKLTRKAMNFFLCSTDRRFNFEGTFNEDVNAYVGHGKQGELFLTMNAAALIQASTQSNTGGMTDMYLEGGTYVKSFYTVMKAPDCVKVSVMGESHRRLHHKVGWNLAVPKIIHERHRQNNESENNIHR